MLNCCHRLNKVTTMVQCDRPAKYGRLKFKINYLELFAKMQSWYCVYSYGIFRNRSDIREEVSVCLTARDPSLSSPLTDFEDKSKNTMYSISFKDTH